MREVDEFLEEKRVRNQAYLSSPWIEALRIEYESESLHKWDNKRVACVCQIFHCTIYEACALVGEFDPGVVRQHQKLNHWPMYLTLQWSKLVHFKLGLTKLPDAQDIASVRLIGREIKEEVAA